MGCLSCYLLASVGAGLAVALKNYVCYNIALYSATQPNCAMFANSLRVHSERNCDSCTHICMRANKD